MTATVRSNGFQGSAQFWAESVKHLYVSSFRYFAAALSQRLLPPFSNLEAEAEQFAENEYARLGTVPSLQESDAADVADLANDNAVTWYISMAAVRQSVINLHAVGLRHLFEQQVFDLVLHVPLRAAATADIIKDLQALRDNGIHANEFESWQTLEELRLVCNVVKHAEGGAATRLRAIRPDLFVNPSVANLPFLTRPGSVFQPLAGEDIYVREADIERYADAVKSFWEQVSQALEQMSRP